MRADIDHTAGEALVAHRRHGDQHLPVEIAAGGKFVGLFAGKFHDGKGYPIDRLLQTNMAAESSTHLFESRIVAKSPSCYLPAAHDEFSGVPCRDRLDRCSWQIKAKHLCPP